MSGHAGLTVDTITWTCEAAPVQAEGTLSDGRPFYFRIRHRTVSLDVDDRPAYWFVLASPDDDPDPHKLSYVEPAHARALLDWLVSELCTGCDHTPRGLNALSR